MNKMLHNTHLGLPLVRLWKALKIILKSHLNVEAYLDYRLPIKVSADTYQLTKLINPIWREPETVAWIEKYCKRDDVFYDIGAGIGAYSLIAHRFSGCKVFAFEPSPQTYVKLCENILLNNGDITCFPMAIGNTILKLFSFSGTEAGRAKHKWGKAGKFVAMFSLDEFISSFVLPLPTVMKIDVDGAEIEVLEGAKEAIENCKTILIETQQDVTPYLEGFKEEAVDNPRGNFNRIFTKVMV